MFKCQECGKYSKPREKAEKKIVEIREKEYTNEFGDVIGKGTEIVKEITVCGSCKSK